MIDQESDDVSDVKKLVEEMLPDGNFYCFKLDDEFDEEREEKE